MKFYKIQLQMLREKTEEYNSTKIQKPQDIVNYINTIENYDMSAQENLIVICLNSKNQVVAYSEISKGNVNTCYIEISNIFKPILISNANKFILVHNHPSGDSTPSGFDLKLTQDIKNAAKIMMIDFLDHIIIGNNEYTSIFETLKMKR